MISFLSLCKSAQKGCRVFAVSIETMSIADEYDDEIAWSNSVVEGEVPLAPEIQSLLHEFSDVFPDELPKGLPPKRGEGHTIPPSKMLNHLIDLCMV
jgi:hypothetical protein